MPTEITLTNILAYDGHGWPQAATRSNITLWQSSSHNPGDGAPDSMRIVPTTSGQEATLTSSASTLFSLNSAHIYYFSCKIKYEQDADCTFDFYWPIAEPAAISHCQMNLVADVWGRMSGVFSRTDFTSGDYQFRFDYNNEGSNIPVRVTSMMLFDLTDSFGAGKEPSKEWLDTYVTAFVDSQTVNYYENLGELFAAIANAIREKDGTTGEIFACDFPSRISALGGSSDPSPTPTYTITLGTNVGSITANGQIPQSEKLSYYVSAGDTIVVTSSTFNANQASMVFSYLPANVSFSKTTNNGTGTMAKTSVTFTMPASNLTVSFTQKSGASA